MHLRVLLFAVMSGIAVLPVGALTAWTYVHAVDKELDGARDKHLVIASNVGGALERYAVDLRNAFRLIANLGDAAPHAPGILDFIRQLDLLHFCVVDIETGAIELVVAPDAVAYTGRVPEDMLQTFRALLSGSDLVFSPVMRSPGGEPVIYLLRAEGRRLALAAVSTAYIVNQSQAVTFGKRGHVAVVDQAGRVIAHPNSAWRQEMRDLSAVAPVQRMMARQTGITTFFSPALQADMVSGYTFVPATGWGVMVPQPVSEIRAEADLVRHWAIGLGLLGIAAAALLSWCMSGLLVRPLSSISEAARRMADGELEARAAIAGGPQPREIRDLAVTFNAMAAEVGAAHRAMAAAASEANRANRAKSEFLACMSHDLRTPLNAVIGFADAMRSGVLDPARSREYLEDILRSANILLGLINDILDLSKIESGHYDLADVPISLPAALESAIDLASVMSRQRRVRLVLDACDGLPDLRSDPRSLSQVFGNLLSNAVKFSHPGGEVRLGCRRAADGGIDVTVADDGIGIRPEDIDRLMQPFAQASSQPSRRDEGTGLGLYICRKIMELHDGNLGISSTPGAGTTVSLHFPAHRLMSDLSVRVAGEV